MKALKVALLIVPLMFLGLVPKLSVASESFEELSVVIEAVVDASWDLPSGPHWRLQPSKKGLVGCVPANPDWAFDQIAQGIESFQAFYADEDLPYEAALAQLEELAASGAFQVCDGHILKGPLPLVLSL